jgi:hypothetical protein
VSGDSRLVHGAFRAEITDCTIEIMDALYGVRLSAEEVKADLRSVQRREARGPRGEGVM